jgi:Acetyltransferases
MEDLQINISNEIEVISSILHVTQDLHARLEPDLYKSFDEKPFFSVIKRMVEHENFHCFVAYKKENPIGAIIIEIRNYPETATTKARKLLIIVNIAVLPEHQKQGIAKVLMDKSFEFAKENNIHEIELNVYSKNLSAISFYNNLGFKKRCETLNYYI